MPDKNPFDIDINNKGENPFDIDLPEVKKKYLRKILRFLAIKIYH